MVDEEQEDYKGIKLYESTYNRLTRHGRMDETYDELVNRILDDFEAGDE